MINQINKLNLSNLDKIKAIKLIEDKEYGYEYLERLLYICFLLTPSFDNKYGEKYKDNEAYKKLIKCDNAKRSIAFKLILNEIITAKDRVIATERLDEIEKVLCDYKMISMKVNINKYKIYAHTITNINTEAIEWIQWIFTRDSMLKTSNKKYRLIAKNIMNIASNNDKNNSDYDKIEYQKIKTYSKNSYK